MNATLPAFFPQASYVDTAHGDAVQTYRIPDWISGREELTHREKEFLWLVYRFHDWTGRVYFSQSWVAEHLHCSTRTIGRYVKKLAALGLITVYRRWKSTCWYTPNYGHPWRLDYEPPPPPEIPAVDESILAAVREPGRAKRGPTLPFASRTKCPTNMVLKNNHVEESCRTVENYRTLRDEATATSMPDPEKERRQTLAEKVVQLLAALVALGIREPLRNPGGYARFLSNQPLKHLETLKIQYSHWLAKVEGENAETTNDQAEEVSGGGGGGDPWEALDERAQARFFELATAEIDRGGGDPYYRERIEYFRKHRNFSAAEGVVWLVARDLFAASLDAGEGDGNA